MAFSGLSDIWHALPECTKPLCLSLHMALLRLLCLALERCHCVSVSTSQMATHKHINTRRSSAGLPTPHPILGASTRAMLRSRGDISILQGWSSSGLEEHDFQPHSSLSVKYNFITEAESNRWILVYRGGVQFCRGLSLKQV